MADNPFQVASEIDGENDRRNSTATTEKTNANSAQSDPSPNTASESQPEATTNSQQVGKGGIGRNVPVRKFNDPRIQPPVWFPDGNYKACMCCETPFGIWTRRHHCRGCGLIFCSSCTPPPMLYMPVAWGMKTPVRCCGTCAQSLSPKQDELQTAIQNL